MIVHVVMCIKDPATTSLLAEVLYFTVWLSHSLQLYGSYEGEVRVVEGGGRVVEGGIRVVEGGVRVVGMSRFGVNG